MLSQQQEGLRELRLMAEEGRDDDALLGRALRYGLLIPVDMLPLTCGFALRQDQLLVGEVAVTSIIETYLREFRPVSP